MKMFSMQCTATPSSCVHPNAFSLQSIFSHSDQDHKTHLLSEWDLALAMQQARRPYVKGADTSGTIVNVKHGSVCPVQVLMPRKQTMAE